MTISSKGAHFLLRYSVSYRALEEIMAERGVSIDHATLNRWLVRYAALIFESAHSKKRPADRSWRMNETYIRVRGQWVYLYRAVDKFGKTLDFKLSTHRNKTAAPNSLLLRWRRMACRVRS